MFDSLLMLLPALQWPTTGALSHLPRRASLRSTVSLCLNLQHAQYSSLLLYWPWTTHYAQASEALTVQITGDGKMAAWAVSCADMRQVQAGHKS